MPSDSFANFVNQSDLFFVIVNDSINLRVYIEFQVSDPQIFNQIYFPQLEISQITFIISIMIYFGKYKRIITGYRIS